MKRATTPICSCWSVNEGIVSALERGRGGGGDGLVRPRATGAASSAAGERNDATGGVLSRLSRDAGLVAARRPRGWRG